MSSKSLETENIRLQQLAALGELAAGVTHESRNLLTAIVGFAQLARQRIADPEASRRHLESIEREALRCVEILDRFLTFSRADGDQNELVDVATVASEVVNAATHQAAMGGVALRCQIRGPLPAVRGRRGELMQVVLNLVINALHATPRGGTILVSVEARRAGVELAVVDSGGGVPESVRARIFEPFFTTKAVGAGTGLGLALCRRIVTAAGGTIDLDPTYDGGARFVVWLPMDTST